MDFRHRVMRLVGLSAVILAVSLGLRLWSVSAHTAEPDELLWRKRSATMVEAFEAGRYNRLTSHLKHPGVAPTAAMAAGQFAAKRINAWRGAAFGSPDYIDQLSAARFANALVSGFCPLVLFIGSASFVGIGAAFLAAMLLALDPHALAASRMAHLDATLMLLVTLALILYWAAVERSSTRLKLLCGLCWGLAIGTKPTAVLLLPIFVVHKFLRNRFVSAESDRGERSLVSWSDFGAFVAGNVLVMVIYQRLWLKDLEALGRLRQDGLLLRWLLSTDDVLSAYPALSLTLITVLAAGALRALSLHMAPDSSTPRTNFHLAMLALAAAFVVALITLFPEVSENTLRFWLYAGSLTHEHPEAGGLWNPPAWGYPELFFRKLPLPALLLVVISALAGPLLLLRRSARQHDPRRALIWCTTLATVLIWVSAISLPEKKVYRYALPILPALYLFASVAAAAAAAAITERWDLSSRKAAAAVACAVLAWYYLGAVISIAPNYRLYASSISGGLQALRDAGLKLHPAGHEKVFEYLVESYEHDHKPLAVGVLGDDIDDVADAFSLRYPALRKEITFVHSASPYDTDYVIVVGGYPALEEEIQNLFQAEQPVAPDFVVPFDKINLFELYHSPLLPLKGPRSFQPHKVHHRTGSVDRVQVPRKHAALAVQPGRHARGFVAFSNGMRLAHGSYILGVEAELTGSEPPPDAVALRVEFAGCKRDVTAAELSHAPRTLSLGCKLRDRLWTKFNLYWPGSVGLRLHSISLSPAEPTPAGEAPAGEAPAGEA